MVSSREDGHDIDAAEAKLRAWNYDVVTCIIDYADKQSWNDSVRDDIQKLCNCTGLAWTRRQDCVPFESLAGVARLLEMPCAPVDSWEPKEA